MKNIRKRMFLGALIIVGSMTSAICMTLVFDFLVIHYGHEDRFAWVFGIGGVILGAFAFIFSLIVCTNNFGEGFPGNKNE